MKFFLLKIYLPPLHVAINRMHNRTVTIFMLHGDILRSYSGLDFLYLHTKYESFFVRPLDQNCLHPYERENWNTSSSEKEIFLVSS